MDGNQVADAAAAITGAGESLIGLGEVAERVQDTLPFGGFWLHDMLSVRFLLLCERIRSAADRRVDQAHSIYASILVIECG